MEVRNAIDLFYQFLKDRNYKNIDSNILKVIARDFLVYSTNNIMEDSKLTTEAKTRCTAILGIITMCIVETIIGNYPEGLISMTKIEKLFHITPDNDMELN